MSNVSVIAEHVEQLLDIYASNPNYNSRAAFLLADDLAELMLKAHVRSWGQKNPGVLSEPSNFPQACFFAVAIWAPTVALTTAYLKNQWENLEPNAANRWRGSHLTQVQGSAEYIQIKKKVSGVEAVEFSLGLHQERNKLYHDPSYMRLGPSESTVCAAIANLLLLGKTLFPKHFEQKLRSEPLGRALYAWFWLHKQRYSNDQVRRSLEECLQNQPSCGLEKFQRLNQEDKGWAFIKDPDFGHGWILLHHESTAFAKALEEAAAKHGLMKI